MSSENNLSKTVSSAKRELIFISIALAAMGLLMVIFPETSKTIICRVIGIVLCVWGAVWVIEYFMGSRGEVLTSFGLVRGIALLAFGGYFIAKPDVLAAFLTTALAILIIVDGILMLQYAIDLSRLKARGWWVQLIGAGVAIALGVVVWTDPFGAAKTLTIFSGVVLLVEGLWDLVSVLYIAGFAKKVKKAVGTTVQQAVAYQQAAQAAQEAQNVQPAPAEPEQPSSEPPAAEK